MTSLTCWRMFFLLALLSLCRPASAICPDLCQCDDDKLVVTCVRAGLEALPNTLHPNLKTMVFKYNEFPTIHFSLTFLHQLNKVDLSHNKIVTISDKAFGSNRDLRELRLDGNKLSQITNKTIFGLTNLRVLSLRGNIIQKLPEGLFGYSEKVQEVDLSRNRIQDIHSLTFKGLVSLEILHLENNDITAIPSAAFSEIGNLAELHLSGNPIKTVSARAFHAFQSLSLLDLSSSRIRVIEDSALRGLGTLRTLKLADNQLVSVPTSVFQDVPNLETLDIGRNSFPVILNGAFRFLTKLKHLELSGCGRLTTIQSGAFSKCIDLEKVTISLNRKLSDVSSTSFDVVPNLRYLSMSDNALQTLSERLLPWRNLHSLDISGNPWRCDCHLLFLSQALTDIRVINGTGFVSDGKCSSPEGLWVSELHNKVMSCQEQPVLFVSEEPQEVAKKAGVSYVILYVSVAVVLLLLTSVFLVAAVKWRSKWVQWIRKTLHNREQKQSHYQPHIPHHQQPHFNSFRRPQNAYEYGCDEEHYYYVPTMQNRLGVGKAIPVTEL